MKYVRPIPPHCVLILERLRYLELVVLSANNLKAEIFLKAHGRKLVELHIPYDNLRTATFKLLELGPSLHSLSLIGDSYTSNIPVVDALSSSREVPSLVKLALDSVQIRTKYDKEKIAAWEKFFMHFEPKWLPNLREIKVAGCQWPQNERDIAKSFWVRWAEILLQHRISLTDKTGTKWRLRLKVK
ncbi:F-box domain-containing protein [Mycena sanguinolenta]|uniref:F-box domain-containing protein n=1 Tax=Mycena sanguinolenta TaxID=230812 RepID=A0A8H6YJG6_9AGAR|nr:F-box domain-containing protein [Mycena sanguinolenta]